MLRRKSFEINRRALLQVGAGAAVATLSSHTSARAQSKTKIGFALESYQVPRWKYLDLPNFKKAVEDAGMEVVAVPADFDASRQLQQIEQLITDGCKAIALSAVIGKAGVNMVRTCKKAGVPVVAYNNLIPSSDVAVYLSRDNYGCGRLAIEAARDAGVLKGNWIVVSGEAGTSVATEATRAYFDVLNPLIADGTVKVVSHKWHTGWDPAAARDQVENALTAANNDIQGILSNNDMMAVACIPALEAAGLAGKVFLNGLDALTEACHAILKGEMTLSAFTPMDDMGRIGGELCVKLAKGEALGLTETYKAETGEEMPLYAIDTYNITKSNMGPYLQKYSPNYVDAKAVLKDIPKSDWPSGVEGLAD